MLPSCGFFKNLPCPFFKLALCVRPHCPYKHQNPDSDYVHQSLPQLVDDSESLLNLTSADVSSSNAKPPVTYVPTPVDSKPAGILKTPSSVSDKSLPVPVYKPTPISKLKECTLLKKSNKAEYEPEFPPGIRKKKNVEEYDPTEVKCVPKKSVTFLDPASSVDSDVPMILISSEEEELDDLEDAPTFSDDDLEVNQSVLQRQAPEVKRPKDTVPPAEDKEIELVEVNEFSVVDKILVDSKKNELLLKAKQNSHLKIKSSESMTKAHLDGKISKAKTGAAEGNSKKEDFYDSSKETVFENKTEKNPVHSSSSKDGQSKSETKDTKKIYEVKVKKKDGSKKETKSHDHKASKSTSGKKENKVKSNKESKCHKNGKKEEIRTDQTHKINKKEETKTDQTKKIDKKEETRTDQTKKFDKKDETKTDQTHKKDETKTDQTHKKVKNKDSNEHKSKKSSEKSSSHKKGKASEKLSKLDSQNNLHSSSAKESKKRAYSESSSKSFSVDNAPSCKKSKNFEESLMSPDSNSIKMKDKSSHKTKSKSKTDNHESPKKKAKIISDSRSDICCDVVVDFSDSDPDEECRRIFNECYPESTSPGKKEVEPKSDASSSSDIVILRKKRLAHPGAADLKKPNAPQKVEMKRQLNPAQVMLNRFAQVQAKFAKSNGSESPSNDVPSKGTDKKKLNFVPNQGLLAAVKHKNEDNSSNSKFSPFLPHGVSTTLKVSHRVAHVPEVALKPRPIIPADFGSKVPTNVRQKFLNAFIDECLKFLPSEDEAYDYAIEEEKKAYARSSSKALYMNVAANTLKRLRSLVKEESEKSDSSKTVSKKPTVSHEAVLNGPLAQRRSFSIGPKKKSFDIKDLSKADLYEHLLQYVLTLEQLKENGFPLPHPSEKDRAVIEGIYANRTHYCNDAFKRVCCRCQKTYYVNVDGDYVRDEECDFHWGRIWKKRIAGTLESRYSCCQGDSESDGCCVSSGHVFEGSENHALKGFVKTLKKPPPEDNFFGIYALDCEMCYTTAGMELTRITVIDTDLKTVYESFVKPQHKVLDFNTRFSGITEADLKNVRTSLHDVQAVLLCIFNDRTILIGHSLESDFKALKIFHRTVVDTSVVFPHKNGLPFKRALKTITAEKLNKIIQNDVGGHDSQEDAAACMELMLWKVKEDLKGNR